MIFAKILLLISLRQSPSPATPPHPRRTFLPPTPSGPNPRTHTDRALPAAPAFKPSENNSRRCVPHPAPDTRRCCRRAPPSVLCPALPPVRPRRIPILPRHPPRRKIRYLPPTNGGGENSMPSLTDRLGGSVWSRSGASSNPVVAGASMPVVFDLTALALY